MTSRNWLWRRNSNQGTADLKPTKVGHVDRVTMSDLTSPEIESQISFANSNFCKLKLFQTLLQNYSHSSLPEHSSYYITGQSVIAQVLNYSSRSEEMWVASVQGALQINLALKMKTGTLKTEKIMKESVVSQLTQEA